MDSVVYFGLFFVAWGLLYIVFAFVGKDNGLVRSFFRIPFIFSFFPVTVGRIISGLICIGFGVGYMVFLAQNA